MKLIFGILLFYSLLRTYSQNDTLCLYKDYYMLSGIKYNQTINGQKQGDWITFEQIVYIMGDKIACGYDPITGEETHTYISVDYKFVPMTQEEEIKFEKVEKTINLDSIWIDTNITIYSNKMPPFTYCITSKGKYINNCKTGKWIYYDINGALRKEIIFHNDIPIKDFKIFREDSSLYITVEILNLSDQLETYKELVGANINLVNNLEKILYKVCRYDKIGNLLDCRELKIDEINLLIN